MAKNMFVDKPKKQVVLQGKKSSVEKIKDSVWSIIYKQEQLEKDVLHIKSTKGVKEYLRHVGSMTDVQYPKYWKCVQQGAGVANTMNDGKRELLDPQSSEYQQVKQVVEGTWKQGVTGLGQDAVGLNHTKIGVRQIWRLENPKLFKLYDSFKKNLCLQASVNDIPCIQGLKGEVEITTRHISKFALDHFGCNLHCFHLSRNADSAKNFKRSIELRH
jgi:hypothetical protein